MKIVIVSDAWHPQVNGVVRTLTRTCDELQTMGHHVELIHPGLFASVPAPFEPGLRAALALPVQLTRLLEEMDPDALHIATEGPLGWAARRAAMRMTLRFTTAFHTRYPEYLHKRFRLPRAWATSVLRRFHAPAQTVMVPSRSIRRDLSRDGFERLAIWGRGVDTNIFSPGDSTVLDHLDGPKFLFVGRVSPEKDLPAFLELDLPGTKVVVGDGPLLNRYRSSYPNVFFTGAIEHNSLVDYYRAADVFVFPSKTDTFGLVLLEALACGLPVAALPVSGPVDVLHQCRAAALNHDLKAACLSALSLSRDAAVEYASLHRWSETTRQFASLLVVSSDTSAQISQRPLCQRTQPVLKFGRP